MGRTAQTWKLIVSAAVQGIFVAALYRYAKTRQVLAGFRLENSRPHGNRSTNESLAAQVLRQ